MLLTPVVGGLFALTKAVPSRRVAFATVGFGVHWSMQPERVGGGGGVLPFVLLSLAFSPPRFYIDSLHASPLSMASLILYRLGLLPVYLYFFFLSTLPFWYRS